MDKVSFLHDFKTSIPSPIRSFLIRAIVIFISWKTLYFLVLLPMRIPDHQLTILTAKTTSLFFNIIHNTTSSISIENHDGVPITAFFINGERAIGIADRCNALELIVLYIGFLFTIPATWRKQLLYLVAGVFGIFILNVLRCYALALLNLNDSSIADVAHKYIFTMIIYSLIFITWVKYSKSYFKNDE